MAAMTLMLTPRFGGAPVLTDLAPPSHRNRTRPLQELVHQLDGPLRLLEVWEVRSVLDHLDPRSPDALTELVGVDALHEVVPVTPHDQRVRGDAVEALVQAPVRDRPDELAGAGQ